MGKAIDSKIDDGLLTFTFTNEEGETFASFKMNPTDVGVAARCEEVAAHFERRARDVKGLVTAAEAAEYDAELKEKIDYLLGYEARDTIFRAPLTPTTIFPDGSVFAFVVLDAVTAAIKPEIEKRRKKAQAAIEKYTAKYENDRV